MKNSMTPPHSATPAPLPRHSRATRTATRTTTPAPLRSHRSAKAEQYSAVGGRTPPYKIELNLPHILYKTYSK